MSTIITSRIATPFVAEIEMSMPILMNGNTQFNKDFEGGHGSTIDVIIPGYGEIGIGPDMSNTNMSYESAKQSVTLVQRHTPVSMTQVEQSLDFSSFDDQVAAPYGNKHGSDIQQVAAAELLSKADSATVINSGTAGYANIGQSVSAIRSARAGGEIFGVFQNDLATQIQNSGLQYFNPSSAISDSFLKGTLGGFRGANWAETPDVVSIDSGDHVTTAALTGTVVGGNVLVLTDTAMSGSWNAGEIITLAGVKVVDIYGKARNVSYAFVVQGTVGVDSYTEANNSVALPIKQIYVSGPLKNINLTAYPAGLAATCQTLANSTYLRGVAWDKQAFVFASANLKPLRMVESKLAKGSALSILVQTGTDVTKGIDIVRWDSLTGFLLARSNWVSSILVKQ